jgi:hypothetical protein
MSDELVRILSMRLTRSYFSKGNPIIVILEKDEDTDELDLFDVIGYTPREKPDGMTDAEAFREEWSLIGLNLVLDYKDKRRNYSSLVVWGRMWWECVRREEGYDYDSGFEIEGTLEEVREDESEISGVSKGVHQYSDN